MELIQNANQAHKMWSMWVLVALSVIDIAYAAMPEFREFMQPATFAAVNAGMALAAKVLRVLKQTNLGDEPAAEEPKQ